MTRDLNPNTYAYCVVKADRKPSMARVPAGLPGAGPPRAIPGPRGTWLIVADVTPEAYSADIINANLNDLGWVSARAIGHEAVVEHFARRLDTVPMKLFTIFRSDARASADIAASAHVHSILKKIAGCAEWSVRVTRRRTPGAPPPEAQVQVSGTAFLLGKKKAREESRAASERARRAAEESFRSLARLARDAVRKEPEVPGTGLMLDAAFLVRKVRQKSFTAAARKLARQASGSGCELTLSGPWPTYHFVAR
jgi:hypothetical protein